MISARLVLATVVGGHVVFVAAGLAAEPVPTPNSALPTVQSQHGASSEPAVGDKTEAWTQAEIAEAKAHCAARLKGLDVVAVAEEPIKKGSCGAAAPVKLISVGKSPEVRLSPPAIVTCDMVAGLHEWLRSDVQPLARKLFDAPIVEIQTMSSYSCRNAYGRARTKLSEHGRANALDIGGFLTAGAQSTMVLAHWGPTEREIRAQELAAAEAARQKAAAQPTPQTPAETHDIAETRVDWTVSIAAQIKGMLRPAGPLEDDDAQTALGLAAPSRLGGPKPVEQTVPVPSPNPGRDGHHTQFLRQIHAAACKHFGTVLGPEANNAHKNHFHLDMAERQRSNFCE